MNSSANGHDLIDAFFSALRLRELEKCEAALVQLAHLAEESGQWRGWNQYLSGILIFERDRDFAEAERVFIGLLDAEPDPTMRGRVLRALGRSYQVQGRWDEAVKVYRQSLSVFQVLGQPIEQAVAWKQMAIATRRGYNQGFFDENVLEKALGYCHSALESLAEMEERGEAEAWLEGSIYNSLGAIQMQLGQWEDAIATYQHDLAICRELDDRHGMGLTYGNLGEVYQKQSYGRGEEFPANNRTNCQQTSQSSRDPAAKPVETARPSQKKALQAFEQALTLITEVGNTYEEAEALANLAYFHQTVGNLDEAIGHYTRSIDLIEAMRSGISSTEVRSGYFETVMDSYANLVNVCLQAGDVEKAFDFVEQARARAFLDSLLFAAEDDSGAFSKEITVVETVTLPDVQRALAEDELLLAYFTTGMIEHPDERIHSARMAQRHRFPEAKTWLFAITNDGIATYDTGLSPNQLLPRRIDEVVERHFLSKNIRRMLYGKLVAPVESMLRGKRQVYLAPHGPLHYLPFQALLAGDGKTFMRANGPTITYGPSASALLHQRPQRVKMMAASCLAVGYNHDGAQQLQFAEEEASQVAALIGGTVMVGRDQKRSVLVKQMSGYRMLHFSCHGEFLPEAPLGSYLQLGPSTRLTAADVLQDLQLNADLVVMSACESGLSKVRRGDELIGFTRSFMHAGARALVASLWKVDEISTSLFMRVFYQAVLDGADYASALKQSQLRLQSITRGEAEQMVGKPISGGDGDERIFAQPFYWAPFVLFASSL